MTSPLETQAEILLVDDIIGNLRLLETVLVEQGYSTRKATNGKLAPISEIKCYPGQINPVFMNILANAIEVVDKTSQEKLSKKNTVEQ